VGLGEEVRLMTSVPGWQDPFEVLRRKWHEVPVGAARKSTIELVGLPDAELLDLWLYHRQQATTGSLYHSRGWYHDMYKRAFRGRRLADVGSGLGYEGVTFAQEGAIVTFVDVAESNLEVIRRVCQLLRVDERTSFVHLKSFDSLAALAPEYDVIWCNGSLHHTPFEIVRVEAQELLRHLRPGGRWIQLAYPRGRWEREGRLPFSEWGRMTDGEATPWAEWYDLAKVMSLLEPYDFTVVAAFEFHGGDFIWFDLRNVMPAELVTAGTHASATGSAQHITRLEEALAYLRQENAGLYEQVTGAAFSYARAVQEVSEGREQTAELREQTSQLAARVAELNTQVELHRERVRLLCQSRWRKLGQRLRIAMRPYWEDEYRERS
jgi:2-polyprenyl-3-methyl-5-hydroxy-6-metoxy-1,4-benzoquinol methylase